MWATVDQAAIKHGLVTGRNCESRMFANFAVSEALSIAHPSL